MADSRRSQLHSCDPCRKGKRGCDAPKNPSNRVGGPCSNCKRWKKQCTFLWLTSKRAEPKRSHRKNKASASSPSQSQGRPLNGKSSSAGGVKDLPSLTPWSPTTPNHIFPPIESSFSFPLFSETPQNRSPGALGDSDLSNSCIGFLSWEDISNGDSNPSVWGRARDNAVVEFQRPESSRGLGPMSDKASWDTIPDLDEGTDPLCEPVTSGLGENSQGRSATTVYPEGPCHRPETPFCTASANTAGSYARASMTRNLIRIYHDSMENALSCWLTEHNCPYSDPANHTLPFGQKTEWGPSWSNRMCIRVCRLDRASSRIRGRELSAQEDRTAARALHLAIIAFASQWTQHAQHGIGLCIPAPVADDERSIRAYVWNEARHALEHSTGIPSFRVVFANIIFSLTQRPLNTVPNTGLSQLLEDDHAPMFLETANRQLFTFRHKLARIKRQAPGDDPRDSVWRPTAKPLGTPEGSEFRQVDPLLASDDHRSTLRLLFWLGVMFDTLSAAMYQRPLVVSDEDSQIASASPPLLDSGNPIPFQGASSNGQDGSPDIWGDFFLRYPAERLGSAPFRPRWPCSYEEAASVLSKATPVKVLLYRRVTQLQTLVYRGASSDCLEEVIRKTLLVYQHWNSTYRGFMLDCVAHHEQLPPRIQSWYVILDGHWHLAAMLLADVVGSIDYERLGSEAEREARRATNFVSSLKVDNAFAVGALARSSLHGPESTMYGHFHDALNEVAFLVEPWTVVLIHSFAKAGYISIESMDMPDEHNVLFAPFRQNCELCIRALQYLGRKSDMASLVARDLSKGLESKLKFGAAIGSVVQV